MGQDQVNIGTGPNSGNGDPIRSAFNKINGDIAELFSIVATKADADSAILTGTPVTVTPAGDADNHQIANMAAVQAALVAAGILATDPLLVAISELTTAANKLIYTTGSDQVALTDLSAFGRSLIDDANAAAGRVTLGLGTMATAASADYLTSTAIASAYQPIDADLTELAGGFVPLGTGAVTRSWLGRGREYVSALDYIPVNLHASILDYSINTDVSSYVQAAINRALSAKRGLYIPAGLYPIHSPLTAHRADPTTPNGLRIQGDGRDQTILRTNTANGSLLEIGNDDDSDITQSRFVVLRGLSFVGPNRDNWRTFDGSGFIAGTGLLLRGLAWSHLLDVYIEGFTTGLSSKGCLTSLFSTSQLRYNVEGLSVSGNSASDANALTALNLSIGSNRDFGATLNQVSVFSYIGGSVEGNGYGALFGYGIKATDCGKAGRVGFALDSVWFESNKGDADVYIDHDAYAATYAARNCSFHRLDGSNYTNHNILVEATTNPFRMHLSGNAFWSGGSYSQNAGRKYISTAGSSGDYEIVADNSNYWMGSTEVPTRGDLSATAPYTSTSISTVFHPQLRSSVLDAVVLGQVPFPATQNASADANTLDDYEEGSWTPVLGFATPGNQSIAYTLQTGVYTKIGRVVHIQFTIVTSTFTHTTAAGNLTVTGLPFAAGSALHRGTLDFGGINAAGYTHLTVAVGGAGASLVFNKSGMGVAVDTVAAADVPTGGTVVLVGSATYFV